MVRVLTCEGCMAKETEADRIRRETATALLAGILANPKIDLSPDNFDSLLTGVFERTDIHLRRLAELK